MADTITVLDGIQFQKETTSDVYTQDHATNEAVKTFPIYIGMSYKAARVIFNGAFDPDGGRFHARVKGLKVTGMTTTGITKTANTQIMEWTTITPPAVLDSGVFDVSASRNSTIHIDIAQSSVTANTTGIEIIVQGRKEDSLDEWTDIVRFNALSYAAVAKKADFAAQEAVGQTILDVTNPATAGLDNVGKFIFLEDTAAIEKCEIAFLVSQSGD
ncbi:hypothetical protein LCGC14_0622050 [marine sediment metagenome]|uniref:Uncharacterized protein n=1 Tax=marine sediment metagenome TaxID=412755 RepID=A0A0F9UD22_9ZZZZ|nr:hypothetical protein [Pricia sp.]